MGLASLGFASGPQINFRINPSEIDWTFQVFSSVTNTIGGRVVQITGETLQDLVVTGYLGEDRSRGGSGKAGVDHPGASWRLAEAFVTQCRAIMAYQSRDASRAGQLMHEPAVFSYPPEGWRWQVYLKAVQEIDGNGSIEHRTGKFSYGYKLTLFPVQTGSEALVKAGQSLGTFDQARANAIAAYLDRISAGVGWKQSAYNGGVLASTPGGSNG